MPVVSELNIGFSSDIHRIIGEADPERNFGDAPGYRDPENAQQSILAAVETFNSANVDLTVWNGDIVNTAPDAETNAEYFQAFVGDLSELNADFYYTIGHHDMLGNTFVKENIDAFFDSDTGIGSLIPTGPASPQNVWWYITATDQSPMAYTIDRNGFRLIFLLGPFGGQGLIPDTFGETGETPVSKTQLEWLTDRMVEAESEEVPTLIFCHQPFKSTNKTVNVSRIPGYLDGIALFEAQTIKPVVFQGHVHVDESVFIVADVTYINFRGDVWAETETDTTRRSHAVVTIEPPVAYNDNGLRCPVTVTGYGHQPSSDLTPEYGVLG